MNEATYLKIVFHLIYAKLWAAFQSWIFILAIIFFLLLFILDDILLYIENLNIIHVLYSLLMLSSYIIVLYF